jgi:hypothetical protein
MGHSNMKQLLCAFAIAAAATAQSNPGAVDGPLLGMVFDPGRGAVRPLTGIPASAALGGLVDSGPALETAAVSASGFAIGAESGTGAPVLISSAGRYPLSGIPAGAGAIVLSPRATAAALYFKGTRTAYIVTGFPDNPGAPRQVALDRQPNAIAVSDDGAALLAIERLGKLDASIYLYRDGRSPALLRNGRGIAGVDFLPGTTDALIAANDGVYLISESFGPQLIAGEADGVAGVAAVAASSDGGRVIIAMRSGQVAVRDRKTNMQTTISCACQPTGLARLRGAGVFRLNEMGDGPLWLLDADSAEPRILFVAGERQ